MTIYGNIIILISEEYLVEQLIYYVIRVCTVVVKNKILICGKPIFTCCRSTCVSEIRPRNLELGLVYLFEFTSEC
jgi:hypothetical protein